MIFNKNKKIKEEESTWTEDSFVLDGLNKKCINRNLPLSFSLGQSPSIVFYNNVHPGEEYTFEIGEEISFVEMEGGNSSTNILKITVRTNTFIVPLYQALLSNQKMSMDIYYEILNPRTRKKMEEIKFTYRDVFVTLMDPFKTCDNTFTYYLESEQGNPEIQLFTNKE